MPGSVSGAAAVATLTALLDHQLDQRQAVIQRDISERNARIFEAEADKLDG